MKSPVVISLDGSDEDSIKAFALRLQNLLTEEGIESVIEKDGNDFTAGVRELQELRTSSILTKFSCTIKF